MRKLIVISFLTLDGVMQAPGGKDEDKENGFEYGGWQVPYFGDIDNPVLEALKDAGAFLLGRKTYDIFAAYWPTEGKNVDQFGSIMNNLTKYVASTTLQKTEWQNSTLLKGDLAEAVNKVKKESGKNIIVFGSGDLCQSLMRHKLIDEYLILIHPLVLGKGKRLFRENSAYQNLQLLKSKTTKDGVLVLTYKPKL